MKRHPPDVLDAFSRLPAPALSPLSRPSFDVHQVTHPDVLDAVCEFRDLAEVQEVVLDLLPPSTRKVCVQRERERERGAGDVGRE